MLLHDARKLFLFINYFVSNNDRRQKEIDYCTKENSESPYFTRVISIGKDKPTKHPKVHHELCKKRPNYRQFIEYCNRCCVGDICVIANADITFDDTIWLLYNIDLSNTFVALTRWKHELVLLDAHDEAVWQNNVRCTWGQPKGSYTQDVWAFQAPFRVNPKLADMTMGYMGCDNKISQIAKDAGYRLVNPSKSIKTAHWHDSGYRTYDHDAQLDVICPVPPCFVEDIILGHA